MRLSMRARMFLLSVAVLAVLGLLGSLQLERALRSTLSQDIESELLNHARMAAELDGEQLSRQAPALGEAGKVRLTLVGPDGTVLADSSADPSSMENHGRRPEIQQAEAGIVGTSRRYSDTLGTDMLYVAIAHPDGVVRVSRPLDQVDERIARVRWSLLGAGGVALLVAALLSAASSHLVTRELRALAGRVRQLYGSEEVGEVRQLERGFDRLSGELDTAVQELAADRQRLARLARVRRDFVSNVSHELRTPVAVLQASSEALLGGALEDPAMAARFAEAIQRQSTRLGDIIEDLLTLARLDAGQQPVQVTELELRPLVVEVFHGLAERAAEAGQSLHNEVAPGTVVRADAAALGIVLTNLVGNAVHYAGPEARIRVEFEEGELRVLDDGPGVPAEHRDRIFERFYRVDPGRSRKMGGTGLGLAIVRHMTLAMGGEISVREAPGGGALFALRLPR